MDDELDGVLKISMQQRGCRIDVVVPESALPGMMDMKEYMRNTGADMYARLLHMMQKQERKDE